MDENEAECPDQESTPASPDSSYSAHTPLQDEPNYEEDDPSLNEQSFFSARHNLDNVEDQTAYFSFCSTDPVTPGSVKLSLHIDEEEQLDYVDDLVDESPPLPQESTVSPIPNESTVNLCEPKKSTRQTDTILPTKFLIEEDGELNSENDEDDIEEGEVLSSSTEGEIDDASDDATDKKTRTKDLSPLNERFEMGPALPLPEFNKENETPWEKALRQTKERMQKAKELRQKEKEAGFDQKMLNQNLLDVEELDPLKQEKLAPLEKKCQIVQAVQPKDDDMLAEYYLAAAADLHRPRFLPSTLSKMDDWELRELKKGFNKKKKSVSRSHHSSSSDSSASNHRSVSPRQLPLNPLAAPKPEAAIEDRLSQWRTANRLGPAGDSWKDPWERRRAARPQRSSPGIVKQGDRRSGSRSSEYSTHSSSRSSSKSSYSSSHSYSRSRSRSQSRSASSSSSYSSRSTSTSSLSKKKLALKSRDKSKSDASGHSKSRSRDTKSHTNDKLASKDLHPVGGSRGRGNASPKSRQDTRNSSNITAKSADSIPGGSSADASRPSVKMHLPSRPKAVLSRPAPPSKRHHAPHDYSDNNKSSNKRSRIDDSALHSESINPTIPLSSDAVHLTRESAIEMQQQVVQDRHNFTSISKRAPPPPRIQDRTPSPKMMDSPDKRYVTKKDQTRSYSSNIPRPVDLRHKNAAGSPPRHMPGASSGYHVRDRHREDRQEPRHADSNSADSSRRDKSSRSQVVPPVSNQPPPAGHRSAQSSSNGPPPSGNSAPPGESKKTAVRRREELLKQLQAVEDAIAKKRAKMSASLKS